MSDTKSFDPEVFESIPWDELRDLGDTSRRRRLWYLVGGASVVAVLAFSVVRTFSSPDPQVVIPPAVPPSSAAGPTSPSLPGQGQDPDPTPTPHLLPEAPATLSEADLRAGEHPAASGGYSLQERQAASYAEWFVLDYFTLDGTGQTDLIEWWLPGINRPLDTSGHPLSFVEWVRTLWVEPAPEGRWRTVVALRRLVSVDGASYSRLPTQSVEVVVDMEAGMPTIVDLPRLLPLPEANPGQWWVGEELENPPTAVLRTAREELLLAQAGAVVGQPAVSRIGEVWRVEWAVTDPGGISWPVSLWIGPNGVAVPAGG
ncbi:MAG: hypothetical protein OXH26_05025 [bacterium]|nr:hypothetical protein [bacterium]MDE0674160.1 hypothetical protein [bacterium]